MKHRWMLCPKTEDSEMHLECFVCGLAPRHYGQYGEGLTVKEEDLNPKARCFGSQELTVDVVRRALKKTGFTLYYEPETAVFWQETLGGIAVKDSTNIIQQPDMVAVWLGVNGDLIVWGDDTVTLTHPSTHRLSGGYSDGGMGYDDDCDAKTLPRNPTENTGWGEGTLFWVREPVPQSA